MLKVEGVPRDDSQRPQSQHFAQSIVPITPNPSPVFKSVVAHRRSAGGQSVSVKVIQANLSFTDSGKPNFEKLGQAFIEIREATANVAYVLSVVQAEFGANYTLVTNDGLELYNSAGTQGIFAICLKLVQDISSINILHNFFVI